MKETSLQAAITACEEIILGKRQQIRLAFCCLLANGHLLIEDRPGVGKTTLANTLARVLGLSHQRIQFTSDLLPADLLGCAIYQTENSQFHFHPGPIFHQLILADEINRTSPKTQSALLEAMEEQQVTVEGQTRPLDVPFFVIATQNPNQQSGTFPLPESQLDRFLMCISLGYPNPEAERRLLQGEDPRHKMAHLVNTLTPELLLQLQQQVNSVHASDALLDYLQHLLAFSRQTEHFIDGLSPRAGMGLLRAARAWALLEQRDYLLPEDLQAVLPAVVGHRLQLNQNSPSERDVVVEKLLNGVAIP
ncbi:MAG: AAA family ATPase [Gammaproteobacteria bacterium]|nr:AAA family ATPase [Gammaproteobacteria bacterium]